MKSTISLHQPSHKATVSSRITNWLESDNLVFSYLMEEPVSNRQTLLVSNAMLSGVILICSAFVCIEALLFVFAWFVWAINLCKKGGIK